MRNTSGAPFMATATNATSAVATATGIAGSTYYITDIAASSDKAGAIILVKDGTTTIWQIQVATTAAGNNSFQQSFQTPLKVTLSADCSITIDGTSACKSNIAGYYL